MTTKCATCSKKLSISTEFKCPCDETKRYCATHRFPEKFPDGHNCPIPPAKVVLPLVVADKLIKI